ncbi:MAG: 4Fe-4S dicluster domain-containing protein [Elusimicrobiota bacterium]
MQSFHITKEHWAEFLKSLSSMSMLYAPKVLDEGIGVDPQVVYHRYLPEDVGNIKFPAYRLRQPIKTFFFAPENVVSTFWVEKPDYNESTMPVVIFGVKACDINAIKVLDKMFLEGVGQDNEYASKRQRTLLISSDCTDICEYCSCNLAGGSPCVTDSGYDLNITPLEDGYIVEVGSEPGMHLVNQKRNIFREAPVGYKEMQKSRCAKVVAMLEKSNFEYRLKKSRQDVQKNGYYLTDLWKQCAEDCVECSGCRFSCPSCYCFLLEDTGDFGKYQKVRHWDSCQYKGYGRVAGGGNPRQQKHERLRNFHSCKLDYRMQNFGFYGCTGCGRCIEVCPVKIDIRKTLVKLENGSNPK